MLWDPPKAPLRPFWERPDLLEPLELSSSSPHSGSWRFWFSLQGASVGQESLLPKGPCPLPNPSGWQSAAHVGRAVGQEVENSVGHAVGQPDVPVTEARVFEGAGVQVAAPAVPVEEPEPEPDDPLAASNGLASLPPFAFEKSQSNEP